MIIKRGSSEVRVLAFLDDGSEVTLIDFETANKMGACKNRVSVNLLGLNQTELGWVRGNAEFSIRGIAEDRFYPISNAFTVSNLSFPPRSLSKSDLAMYPHLERLRDLQTFPQDIPKILIGQDNRHLLDVHKIVCGSPLEPAASYTLLGWVFHGVDTKGRKFGHCFNLTRAQESQTCDQDLHDLVKSYFTLESLGVQKRLRVRKADDRALKILRDTTRFENGKWETGFLWKSDEIFLPDNYSGAFKRLRSIETKLDKNRVFAEKYYREMDRLFAEGYAVQVDECDVPRDGSFWYIPHFGALHPNKLDKVRIVWDLAYRFNGVSLNDCLLAGPDLLNCLFSVLTRFRVVLTRFRVKKLENCKKT